MKTKSLLPLMEQLIMLLVFALASALCLQGFALAGRISRRQESRTRAALEVQNAAELLKGSSGDYNFTAKELGGICQGQVVSMSYNAAWESTAHDSKYVLRIMPLETATPLLGSAHIGLYETDDVDHISADSLLFELTIAWQERATGGDGT